MVRLAYSGLALGLILASAGSAGAQDEIVESGNQYYQAGDYPAAVEAYQAVLAEGFESADLFYNLGNAHFKIGELGRSILNWERALVREPGDPDASANLELARSLTADEIEPLPRFWLLSVVWWWVDLVPRFWLVFLVGAAWLVSTVGVVTRILARTDAMKLTGLWAAAAGLVVVLVLGTNLIVRELGIGTPERAVILAESVSVRSAPAADDDLTVFEVHEGTRVRIDQRTEEWAEIVLEDGKVGWVPVAVMEVI
jgi:tetratricopeptide (TPR) repeat protein